MNTPRWFGISHHKDFLWRNVAEAEESSLVKASQNFFLLSPLTLALFFFNFLTSYFSSSFTVTAAKQKKTPNKLLLVVFWGNSKAHADGTSTPTLELCIVGTIWMSHSSHQNIKGTNLQQNSSTQLDNSRFGHGCFF